MLMALELYKERALLLNFVHVSTSGLLWMRSLAWRPKRADIFFANGATTGFLYTQQGLDKTIAFLRHDGSVCTLARPVVIPIQRSLRPSAQEAPAPSRRGPWGLEPEAVTPQAPHQAYVSSRRVKEVTNDPSPARSRRREKQVGPWMIQ